MIFTVINWILYTFILSTTVFSNLTLHNNKNFNILETEKVDVETEIETEMNKSVLDLHSYKIYGMHEQVKSYDIIISYPQIYGMDEADFALQNRINTTIKTGALDIMNFYGQENLERFELDIYYEITLVNDEIMSIQYFGFAEGEGYPHCHKLFYTTNIDLKTGDKLRLSNIIDVDSEFTTLFLNKKFEYVGPMELDELSLDSIYHGYSNYDMMLQAFKDADSMEQMEIYSYLTKDGLGIALMTYHAIGGYAKFEIDYQTLEKYSEIDFIDEVNLR